MENIASISRAEIARQRADREAELQRLALVVVQHGAVASYVADLLVFLGVLINTPQAKRGWAARR